MIFAGRAHHSNPCPPARCFFSLLLCFLAARRRSSEPFVFFVFFLGLVFCSASVSSSVKRSSAARRFAAWERCRRDTTLNIPFLLIRVANSFRRRSFCSEERLAEFLISNRKVTRVFTLLTFCPPGLLLREKANENSRDGISMFFDIWTIDETTKKNLSGGGRMSCLQSRVQYNKTITQ